ncbi:putative gibberellin 20-oxidase [Aspergillus transmontanensis]|uniref:Putative gibberellin 20-oxidase n=1 Tax=Aspergillus transmontanensis TaxID=1034304 RepID=A0A5N6W4X8_9EURO|nr:putative gibberellin 20-oxidase [Aspergillus transmontanensis]
MSVPIIDFYAFQNGTEQERRELAHRITEEFKKHGATRLINHGIDGETIKKVYEWSDKFFKLSETEKAAIANVRDANPQRGYSYVGSEATSKVNKKNANGEFQICEDDDVAQDLEDVKEHFDFTRDGDPDYPTPWPSEASIPGFHNWMEGIFLPECQKLARDVLTAIEIGLNVPEGTFTACMESGVDELRIQHYPPLSTRTLHTGKIQRCHPHTDFGFITLLFQDATGGLEIEDRANGGWIPVVPTGEPTEVGVYISDTLVHKPNGHLKAAVHQVTAPVSLKNKQDGFLPERYTVALFAKADRHANIGPLPQFITTETPSVSPTSLRWSYITSELVSCMTPGPRPHLLLFDFAVVPYQLEML